MPHVLTDEEWDCLEKCGSYSQYRTMRQRFESGHCGFCEIDPAVNTVQYENDHWIAWENAFQNNRPCNVMLVIISKQHVRLLRELSRDAWTAFYDVLRWAEDTYALPGGMLFARFGDMRLNAGTVPHFHWNLWVPDGSAELRVPIFKDPKAQEADRERALHFGRKYEAEDA